MIFLPIPKMAPFAEDDIEILNRVLGPPISINVRGCQVFSLEWTPLPHRRYSRRLVLNLQNRRQSSMPPNSEIPNGSRRK
jgi:hypothetical protein